MSCFEFFIATRSMREAGERHLSPDASQGESHLCADVFIEPVLRCHSDRNMDIGYLSADISKRETFIEKFRMAVNGNESAGAVAPFA